MNDCYIFGELVDDPKDSLKSKLVFTYRINFENFKDTMISEDVGWGCTLRCGQMLLGNVIIRKLFGNNNSSYIDNDRDVYQNIISQFNDNYNSVFSIHNFLKLYPLFNKKIGDWIGPYTLGQLINYFNPILKQVYQINHVNCCEGLIDNDDIKKDENYLLTIPLRLGVDKIEKIYHENIYDICKLKEFTGMIAGTNHSSYFIIGTQGKNFIYLDPHHIHTYSTNIIENEYHLVDLNLLELTDMMPTIAFCFYTSNIDKLISKFNNIPNNQFPKLEFKTKKNNNFDCQSNQEWELVI